MEEIIDEQPEQPATRNEKIGFWIFVIVVLFAAFFIIDLGFLNCKYHNKFWYKPNCEYKVPAGYKIVYSEETRRYAIKDLSMPDYYLYYSGTSIRWGSSAYRDISLFEDSCHAKAFLKSYIDENSPKMINYK